MSDTILVQYGLVSGLWNMSFSIGDILGPTVGGLAVENFGFSDASTILALVGLCLVSIGFGISFNGHYRAQPVAIILATLQPDKVEDVSIVGFKK